MEGEQNKRANLAAEEDVSTSMGMALELTHLADLRPCCPVSCGSIDGGTATLWRICMFALFAGAAMHFLSLAVVGYPMGYRDRNLASTALARWMLQVLGGR